jgi:hypothetical protein
MLSIALYPIIDDDFESALDVKVIKTCIRAV